MTICIALALPLLFRWRSWRFAGWIDLAFQVGEAHVTLGTGASWTVLDDFAKGIDATSSSDGTRIHTLVSDTGQVHGAVSMIVAFLV